MMRSLADCALDLRDADLNPFQHIGVHWFRLAPDSQRIEFILQNRAELAQVLICIASANDKRCCGVAIVIAIVLQHLGDGDVIRPSDSNIFPLFGDASDCCVRSGAGFRRLQRVAPHQAAK